MFSVILWKDEEKSTELGEVRVYVGRHFSWYLQDANLGKCYRVPTMVYTTECWKCWTLPNI
jgi:hypothetical protein